MSKHTEGPWSIRTFYREGMDRAEYYIEAADRYPIATIDTIDGQEARKDARLIAAAPDLLDACKTAIQQCTTLLVSQGWNERWDSITGGEWAGPVITNIMQAADAAIAKAEGGQQ